MWEEACLNAERNVCDVFIKYSIHRQEDVKKLISFTNILENCNVKSWPETYETFNYTDNIIKSYEDILRFNRDIFEDGFYRFENNDHFDKILESLKISFKDKILQVLANEVSSIEEQIEDIKTELDCYNDQIEYGYGNKKKEGEAKIILFCLTYDYYTSEEFKEDLRESQRSEKVILVAQLEGFNITFLTKLKELQIFRVYKNENEGFEGNEFRKMLTVMEKHIGKKLKVN
jgi:hypothetical protein